MILIRFCPDAPRRWEKFALHRSLITLAVKPKKRLPRYVMVSKKSVRLCFDRAHLKDDGEKLLAFAEKWPWPYAEIEPHLSSKPIIKND